MKKTIYTFLLLSITVLNIYAQQGWFWQNPLPQGNYLSYVNFWGSNGIIIGNGSTILKSSNYGLNWNLYNLPAYNFVYQSIVFDQNNFMVATDNNILMKTTNGGANWFSSSYIPGITPYLFFINMNTGYSIVKSDYNSTLVLYKTINGGNNWNLNLTDSSSRIIVMYFPDEMTGYLGGYRSNGSLPTKLLKTTNGGNSWDSLTTNTIQSVKNLYFINSSTGFMSVGGGRIYKTTNGASSWDSVATTGSGGLIYFINSNTGFISGQYNTFKTTNCGLNWSTISIPSYNFHYNGTETYTAVGEYGSIYRSTNNGANWINNRQSVHNGYCNEVEAVDENTAYIGCDNGIILKTVNGGANWTSLFDPQMNYYLKLYFFNSMTGFAAGLSSGAGSSIKKTTNGGLNWINTYAPNIYTIFDLSFPSITTGYVSNKTGTFAKTTDSGLNWFQTGTFDAFAAGGLYFVNETTGFWVGSSYVTNAQIRKTTNGGYNWTETLLDSVEMLYDVKFKNAQTGFACGYYQTATGYYGAIFKTTNQGISWVVQYPLTNMIRELSIADESTVYACCDNGKVLKSTNDGITWGIYQSCYSSYLESIDFINQNTGYACSYGGIIIKTTTGGELIGIEPISSEIPDKFELFQNYPNPFNPVTKIKFSVPKTGIVNDIKLTIYDITGRVVINYQYSNLNPGTYSIEFDGTNFASGVYFYRVESGNFRQTRKMVLIK